MKYDENGEFQKGGLACPPNQVETDESRHQSDVIRSNTRFTHEICDIIFYFLSNVHSNFSKNHGFHLFSMIFIGFGIFEDRCACPGDTNIEITGHWCRNVFSRVRKHSNISHSWGSEHFGHPWNSRATDMRQRGPAGWDFIKIKRFKNQKTYFAHTPQQCIINQITKTTAPGSLF